MKIQVKRGLKADLKLLDQAEFGFCTDTKELFIGDGLINIPLGVTGANGADGVSIEYTWNGTQLGIKREDETNYTYVELKGQKGDQGIQGIQGIPGAKGDKGDIGAQGIPGKNIEFVWNGTQLGVRQQGQITYTYTNLQGEQGIQGPKGDKGDTGLQGPIGLTGATGANGFTWRPSIDLNGNLSWTNNGSTTIPANANIRGPQGIQGAKGADGLTTSVKLGSTQYNHSNGVISLPAYPTSLPANGGVANGINFIDTRSVDDKPSALDSKRLTGHFKSKTVVGNPPVGASSTHVYILNVIGWSSGEGSGGWPIQLAIGAEGLAYRQAVDANTWGVWTKISNNKDMPTKLSELTNDSGYITISSSITGNSATTTKLQTPRKINGVNFDGTTDITITANPNSHKHAKADITDFPSIPTKLSELQNDIGAGGGTNIVCSSTEPSIKPGEWWYKE